MQSITNSFDIVSPTPMSCTLAETILYVHTGNKICLKGYIYEGKKHALEFYSCKHNISSYLNNEAVQFAG